MKLPALTLLCVAWTACASERRPESAYDSSKATSSEPIASTSTSSDDEPRLSPASGVGAPRATTPERGSPAQAANTSGIDQGASAADLDVTREIRRALVSDNSLSFTAKNVIIMTRDGRVTLRGQVNTAQERATVEQAARKVGAVKQVNNELELLE